MVLCMHSLCVRHDPTFGLVAAAGPRSAQGGVLGVRGQPGGGGGAGRLLGRQEHVGRQREPGHGASWLRHYQIKLRHYHYTKLAVTHSKLDMKLGRQLKGHMW